MADGSVQLGDLKIAIVDAAKALADAFVQGQTFAGLPAASLGPGAELLPKPLALTGSDTLAIGSTSLALGAAGSYHLFAFAGQFADPDGIAAPAAGAAWLKHELDGQVSGQGGGTAAGITFGLSAGVTARLLDYRRYPATDPVTPAVLADIAHPRFPNRIGDLQAMAAGDALALVVSGTLAFKASFTYASLLSASIAALDNLLQLTGASAFTVDTGGSVEVDFGASDAFRLVFTPGTQRDLAVNLQKTASTSATATAGLAVEAKFTNVQQLAPLVESYLTTRLGTPYKTYQDLLAKLAAATDVSQLDPTAQALVQQIVSRLGLGDAVARFDAIKTELLGLPAKLLAWLESVLSQHVKIAFTISYSRVSTDQTLASFEAAAAALEPFLLALLLGDFSGVAARLAAGDPQFVLLSYLSTHEVKTGFSFGVSLAVGGWAAGGVSTVNTTLSLERNIQGQKRVSFDGRQRYTSQWGSVGESYGFELAAAMAQFAAAPAGADFAFSLGLGWMWDQTLSPQLEQAILDLANVWRVVDPAANAGLVAALAPMAGQSVHAELDLAVGDEGVRRLAIVPEPTYQAAWVQAMAEALPPLRAGSSLLRADVRQRRAIYANAAASAFGQHAPAALLTTPAYGQAQPPLSAGDLALLRAVDLGSNPPGNLAVYGLDNLWNPESATVSPWQLYQRVVGAFRSLGAFLAGQKGGYPAIQATFSEVQAVVGQDYPARLFGSLLGHVLGGAVGLVAGTLTVTPKAGGPAVVIGGA
jgi:hypothetical protein